jgi:hypothetical protein
MYVNGSAAFFGNSSLTINTIWEKRRISQGSR